MYYYISNYKVSYIIYNNDYNNIIIIYINHSTLNLMVRIVVYGTINRGSNPLECKI